MKNMRKIILMLFVFVSMIASVNFLDVTAKTAPKNLTMKSKSKLYYFTNGTNYISGYHFYRKQFTNGTYGYCVSNINTKVPAGLKMTSKGAIKDKGLDYIIKNGWPNKTFTGNAKKDYYITQSAIWEYFDQTKGSHNWNTSFTAKSTGMKAHVYNLVTAAKVAKNSDNEVNPTLKVNVSNTIMNLNSDKTYFVSGEIGVTLVSTKGTYTVSLESAPAGTILKNTNGEIKTEFNDGEKFVVYVPASSIQNGEKGSVTFKIHATGVTYVTYSYSSGKSGYQKIAPTETYEELTDLVSAPLTLEFSKDKIVTKVRISKQDIATKKELPGAMLSIKDSNGKVVEQWMSTNEPHYIEGLTPGKYTLGEAIAPAGYVLSYEQIPFTVRDDGTVTTVIMYNAKENVTKVKISKQDISSKEELPGATLEIKDSNGKVVEKWVSTNEPHYVEGLPAGEYTLTETQAPDGYVLSKESVKFTVKGNGSVTNVTMYNAKQKVTKVKISKQDITSKEELPGATLELRDKNGKLVEKWVSSNEPHYIEGLAKGTYYLTETIAPSGYILSTETIEFEIKSDGSVTSVVMYNAKETKVTKVKVSKQDITNNKEVEGATLVIKNSEGKVVDEWVSTTEPHYIEGLNPGKYTLTETIAPKGYTLSKETITFTVKDDGSMTSVVMYNTPQTEVPITDMNVSPMTMVIASFLIALGTGVVIYYVKFAK